MPEIKDTKLVEFIMSLSARLRADDGTMVTVTALMLCHAITEGSEQEAATHAAKLARQWVGNDVKE